MDTAAMGNIILLLSLIPLVFLVYTLVNLNRLQIGITHPRVIVESAIFVALVVVGVFLIFMMN